MSEHAEHKNHIGKYLKVFAALMVLTVITVAVSEIHMAAALGLAVALTIAATKGGLVAAHFMHLIGEHKAVFWVLMLTLLFFLILLLVPILVTSSDYSHLPL